MQPLVMEAPASHENKDKQACCASQQLTRWRQVFEQIACSTRCLRWQRAARARAHPHNPDTLPSSVRGRLVAQAAASGACDMLLALGWWDWRKGVRKKTSHCSRTPNQCWLTKRGLDYRATARNVGEAVRSISTTRSCHKGFPDQRGYPFLRVRAVRLVSWLR